MRRVLAALLALSVNNASAQTVGGGLPGVSSINGQTGAVTTVTVPGFFTVQTYGTQPTGTSPLSSLTANANPGRFANVQDLAGVGAAGGTGIGRVYSTGTCWRRDNSQVTPQSMTVATTVAVTALVMSSIIQLSGTSFASAATVNVTGACPGDVFTILVPSGVFTVLGTLGLSINGASALSISGLTSGSWGDYVYTGSAVQKIRGGTL